MRKNSVIAYIKDYATTQPDKYAVCELRKNVTYSQYWERICKMATILLTKDVIKGTHVVLRCTQNIDYLVIFSALQYIGAIPIPVEKTSGADRMKEIAEAVDATVIIADEEMEGVCLYKSKELVKEAIWHANRKTPKHFFDILVGKRYDKEDMIILRENDFLV